MTKPDDIDDWDCVVIVKGADLAGLSEAERQEVIAAARDESRAKKRAKAESKSWRPILIKRATLDAWSARIAKAAETCPTCGQAVVKSGRGGLPLSNRIWRHVTLSWWG
jgi:hypothetical protein